MPKHVLMMTILSAIESLICLLFNLDSDKNETDIDKEVLWYRR